MMMNNTHDDEHDETDDEEHDDHPQGKGCCEDSYEGTHGDAKDVTIR